MERHFESQQVEHEEWVFGFLGYTISEGVIEGTGDLESGKDTGDFMPIVDEAQPVFERRRRGSV